MQLTCSALAPLSNELSCETGSFSHLGNPCHSPVSSEPQFPVQPAPPALSNVSPQFFSASPAHTALLQTLTGLVVVVDFFFNSLVVGSSMQFDFLALLVVY